MTEESSSEDERIVLLTINLGHAIISPLDHLLIARISRKIKNLRIGDVECTGSGGGAIDMEISVASSTAARKHLTTMMAQHFPKTSYEIDDSGLAE